MTYLEAALQVLRDAGDALHYTEITERAVQRRLIEPKGQTPELSMGSQLYVAAKKAAEGKGPAIVDALGRGRFGLSGRGGASRLDDQVRESNDAVKADLLSFIREIEPRQLEYLVGQLLAELGYEDVEVTRYVGDQGIDVVATLTAGGVASVRTAVQVKRQAGSVGGPVVQQLRGSLDTDQRGLIITTGSFSPAARREAETLGRLPIALVAGEHLVELMMQNGIGVRSRSVEIRELDLESLVFPEEEGVGERAATLWPLPGGQNQFFESLLKFLDAIGEEGVELSEMTQWVIDNFERVTKEGLVNSYLRAVLYSMGLVRFDGERVLLTDDGRALRQSRSREELRGLLERNILGVSELIEILEQAPVSLEEAHSQLTARISRDWETTHQTRFRLQWLVACGVAQRSGGRWRVVAGDRA
jgi:hypothetical protein